MSSSSSYDVPVVNRLDVEAWKPTSQVVAGLQRLGLILGVLGVIGAVVGYVLSPDTFFRAYLVGWVYCVGIAFGCLALSMLNHLVGGGFLLVVRRVLEAGTRTIPVLFVAAVPLALGLERIYPWANAARVKADVIMQAKAPYLNSGFFLSRIVLYFAIGYVLSSMLNSMSLEQDRTGNPDLARRMRMVSGPGIIIYCLMTTFASVDWMMSIETHWSSTMYGFYLIVSQALSALVFTIVVAFFLLSRNEPMAPLMRKKFFHDYGKLFLALTMLWTYMCFSQFLIIWAGNLPEEIFWYRHRILSGWGVVAGIVIWFHFALPFALLLSRDFKERPRWLARLAIWVMLMRLVDIFWQVAPAYSDGQPALYWIYLAVPAALFGGWLWLFGYQLKQRSLLPVHDAQLPEVVRKEVVAT
jgi:hypothetical protein